MKVLLVTNSTVLGTSLASRITAEQGLVPTVISFDEVPNFILQQRAPANNFDIILCDEDAQQNLSTLQGVVADLREHSGAASVRCGLMVMLRQKFSEEVLALDGVDFAIAKPVPQVAIQRMLSSDGQFWLDRSDENAARDNLAGTSINANILVAEDNPVNQKLITEVLKIFGCQITLVENGREAVSMYQQNQYDMVLMDCQMPEMDGFQATKLIRSMEQETDADERAVIVALTANARKEDRDKCLACGMNDYLSKPFTMTQLRNIIFKWHNASKAFTDSSHNLPGASVEEIDSPEKPAEDGLLDVDTLNGIRVLQNPQAPDILGQLLEIYLSNAPELIKQLHSAIQDECYESIRDSAHSLKSASGNIGARKVFELSARLENMARDNEIDGAGEILEEIERLFPVTCSLLQKEIRRPAA